MFKYRFACPNKERALNKIEQIEINDYPRRSIWGINLYGSGIHFQKTGEIIKGFYLGEGEYDRTGGAHGGGSPIRVCFIGKFVEDEGNLFFDVYIYPNIFEVIFFICALGFAGAYGDVAGLIVATLILSFFVKGYFDMIKDTYHIFERIFK